MSSHCSCHIDALIEEAAERRKQREGVHVREQRIAAHQQVVDDWLERHGERPDDIRQIVWADAFYTPANPSKGEQIFIKSRRLRREMLQWSGDLS